jgi:hypothetical protein
MGVVSAIVFFLCAVLSDRATIAAENLARRSQRALLQVSVQRPRLRKRDRIFRGLAVPYLVGLALLSHARKARDRHR